MSTGGDVGGGGGGEGGGRGRGGRGGGGGEGAGGGGEPGRGKGRGAAGKRGGERERVRRGPAGHTGSWHQGFSILRSSLSLMLKLTGIFY